jgi:hypothetical protein
MAIAFDSSASGAGTSTSPLVFSHTCTGSNLILFVSIGWGANSVTAVTYNGVALTKIAGQAQTGVSGTDLYYLINPATGANNVSISFSSSGLQAVSASYTGAKQSGQPDSFNVGNTTGATSLTVATTVVAANCWLVGGFAASAGTIAAGTGTTQRQSIAGPSFIGDSNGTVATGSQSLQATDSSVNWAGIVASIAPAATSTFTPRRSLMGVGF